MIFNLNKFNFRSDASKSLEVALNHRDHYTSLSTIANFSIDFTSLFLAFILVIEPKKQLNSK